MKTGQSIRAYKLQSPEDLNDIHTEESPNVLSLLANSLIREIWSVRSSVEGRTWDELQIKGNEYLKNDNLPARVPNTASNCGQTWRLDVDDAKVPFLRLLDSFLRNEASVEWPLVSWTSLCSYFLVFGALSIYHPWTTPKLWAAHLEVSTSKKWLAYILPWGHHQKFHTGKLSFLSLISRYYHCKLAGQQMRWLNPHHQQNNSL